MVSPAHQETEIVSMMQWTVQANTHRTMQDSPGHKDWQQDYVLE